MKGKKKKEGQKNAGYPNTWKDFTIDQLLVYRDTIKYGKVLGKDRW